MKLSCSMAVSSMLVKVRRFLTDRDVESYLVGGCVRDMLLGRATADIDIAVKGDALEVGQEVANVFGGKYVLLDEKNGIARVVFRNKEEQQFIDFSTMRGDIKEDLAHRDFTIDAMAVKLRELEDESSPIQVIDPFGGQNDLKDRLVRAVSKTSFSDDPARLLRAVRLAAELDFTIETKTRELISAQSQLIAGVAGERVREELCRLLAAHRTAGSLRTLDELGLLGVIIPELNEARGVEQPWEHFWDVFDHSIETVAAVERLLKLGESSYHGDEVLNLVPWSPQLTLYFEQEVASGVGRWTLLKIAALLHDVAKPRTKSTAENGRTHFLGHCKEGAAMAGDILERLRFSNREIDVVKGIVRYHLRPTQMGNGGLPSHRAIYRYFRDVGDVAIDTLFLSLADHLASRGPSLDLAGWRQHTQVVEYVLSEHFRKQSTTTPQKLIDGHDVINIFGLSPSPRIGELLEAVREAQAGGEVRSREEALSLVGRLLSSDLRCSGASKK